MRVVAGEHSVDVGARWASDGSLLFVSDADGWFQVVRLTADGHDRIVLTAASASTASPRAACCSAPDPRRCPRRTAAGSSTSRSTTDSRTSSSARWPEARPRSAVEAGHPRRRGPSPPRRPAGASTRGTASGSPSAGRPTAPGSRRPANARSHRRTCGSFPSRAWLPTMPAPARSRTRCRSPFATPSSPSRIPTAERIAVTARDGLRVEGTLWRPHTATGKRGGTRVPVVVYPHGGPTAQAFRSFIPFKQVLVAAGFAVLDVDFRGLDRLRPHVPHGQPRRVGPRRRPGRHRRRALGGRPAVGGRASRDLRRVVRRLHGPVRARRGAVAVARRRRPVRRFGDRRELSTRRPARPARPAQDDGLARRRRPRARSTAAARPSTGRSGSRRRCCSSTAGRTSGSCRS